MAAIAKDASAQVMAAEGTDVDPEDILVTTGGQQVIDLVCKTLIDPGDVIVAEAPTYPGAMPAFCAYQADVVQIEMDADGMPIDVLEETLDRLEREGRRPKFIYTIPNFQNPGGVTMSLPRRRRLVEVAAERELLVLEDNPYGLLRYEGEPLPTLLLARRRRLRHLPRHVLEDPLAGPAARLGGRAAPVLREDEHRQAGRRPVLVVADAATSSTPTSREGQLGATTWSRCATCTARRRDAMLEALGRALPGRGDAGRSPRAACSSGRRCPTCIDTTDLLARALQRNVAFVPGRAAYLDGRGGSSMRLNFSGVDEDDIREGVRRIGEVVAEQVELLGTLTGARAGAPPRRRGRAGRGRAGARRRRCTCRAADQRRAALGATDA